MTSGIQSEKAVSASGEDALGFCPVEKACGECHSNCKTLRDAGLRPTRQRVALADLLFSKGDRHISAEVLFEEASGANIAVSLATIYNTLHQFTEAGLLKAISIDSSKTYFDTNTGDHHHFFLEDTQEVIDMPEGLISVANLPAPPEGTEIASIDVVVRVRRK
ncbi:MAG: iron response transcriptional regulator IrrA [Salaquimonas sp.]